MKLLSMNGTDIDLNSRTPQCIISGNNNDDMDCLVNRMIETIKQTGGGNANLHVLNNCNNSSFDMLRGGMNGYFRSRYEELAEHGSANIEKYNTHGRMMPYEIFFFPDISVNDKSVFTVMKETSMLIQVGVHVICSVKNYDSGLLSEYFQGFQTRFLFPFSDMIRNKVFFYEETSSLPDNGRLWYRVGIDGKVRVLK